MKKLFFFAGILAMTALASCGNKQNAPAEGETIEVAAPEDDDVVSMLDAQLKSKDPNALMKTLAAIKEKYAQLVKAGKLEEAKAYMAKAQTYLKEHAAQITAIAGEDSEVSNLVNSVTSMPEAAQNAAEEAAKAVDAKTKEAVETAKSDAKAKVNEAAAKANAKINKKANEAGQKAHEAVGKAAAKAMKEMGLE